VGRDPSTYNVISFRGLDNPTYYSLTADYQYSWDNTGVGGNYNTFNPVAQDLIVDSLAYWRDTRLRRLPLRPGVGARQHLRARLLQLRQARRRQRAEPHRPRAAAAARGRRHGPRSHRRALGDRRQPTRSAASPRAGPSGTASIATTCARPEQARHRRRSRRARWPARFAGSSDLYGDDGRRPWHSVNFLVAHDGFTHRDLYACNGKNNRSRGRGAPPTAATDDNDSWDQGERRGRSAQGRAQRHGADDAERGHADDHRRRRVPAHAPCNNNPYNLDSEANWLNYSWSTDQTNFRTFTQRLITFRNAHPALRPASFYSGSDTNGNVMEQLRWFTPAGQVPDASDIGPTRTTTRSPGASTALNSATGPRRSTSPTTAGRAT
jgi:isoamylase